FFTALEMKTGASDPEQGAAQPVADEPAPAGELGAWQGMLLGMLQEECEEAQAEWHTYSKQHVDVTPALRGSLCAPRPEDRLLPREQALVDGLLIRKYRVLLEMQRERRRAEAEEGEAEWDAASLGLIEPEGGPGPGPESGPAALPGDGGKVDA